MGKIYAHRGLHGHGRVENSPGAFAAALAAGHGIECDVRKTADGRAVVFHDAELDRLTAEHGPVGQRGVAQLTGIALGASGETIPTLRDLLAQVAGKVPLLVELKTRAERPVSPLCLAVRHDLEGYRGQVAVMSFDPRVGAWFARHAPHVTRGLVVTEQGAKSFRGLAMRHWRLWTARPDFLAYDVRDLPSGFAAVQRRRGLPVLTWTVATTEQAERAAEHADAPIAEGEGLAFIAGSP